MGLFGLGASNTKKFDGKWYEILNERHSRKSDAIKQAHVIRSRGHLARIIKVEGYWRVYMRKK